MALMLRGIDHAALRLMRPSIKAALRWALYAEKVSDGLGELRAAAARELPKGVSGADVQALMAERAAVREHLKGVDAILYPDDADG